MRRGMAANIDRLRLPDPALYMCGAWSQHDSWGCRWLAAHCGTV